MFCPFRSSFSSFLEEQYFVSHLSLSSEDANMLHQRYYKDYGLAIEGLVRHHKVDPMEYNSKVDDALPLENVITNDPDLRRLLLDLDRTKVKPWLFTNAYVTHGRRVVQLLGVDDMFEGMTFCDYAAQNFLCKPSAEMFEVAQKEAGAYSARQCLFVDDSAQNCRAARSLGWKAVHLVEPSVDPPPELAGDFQIEHIEELRNIFSGFFKAASTH